MNDEFAPAAGDPEGRPPLASPDPTLSATTGNEAAPEAVADGSSEIPPAVQAAADAPTGQPGDDDADPDQPLTRKQRRERWRKAHPTSSHVLDFATVVGVALILSFLIKTFLAQPFVIPSESMEDTFVRGDRVVVSKLSTSISDVRRGDIVVFRDDDGWLPPAPEVDRNFARRALEAVGLLPETEHQYLIKRIIGVGGDSVECCDSQGRVTVNGQPITESYLKPGAIPSQISFSVQVPDGKLWVLGDNRQNSGDSRFHMGDPGGGYVDEDQVVGTAFATVWPLNRLSWHTNPESVFDQVPSP